MFLKTNLSKQKAIMEIKQSFQVSKKQKSQSHSTHPLQPSKPRQSAHQALEVSNLRKCTRFRARRTQSGEVSFANKNITETRATSREKRRPKITFYFFTYELSRRRLSLMKMINEVDEVFTLLCIAFGYEYLF
jgi:hypothetical protein